MSAIRRMMMRKAAKEKLLEVTLNEGFINTEGNWNGSNDFYYTSVLPIKAGQQVTFTGYSGAACSAIFSGNEPPYTLRVKGIGSTRYGTYTWTADTDDVVGFSAKRGTNPPLADIDGVAVVFKGY